MTANQILKQAETFLEDYRDPEIDKRLCFDAWSDRMRLNSLQKGEIWVVVKYLTRRRAALRAGVYRSGAAVPPASAVADGGRG